MASLAIITWRTAVGDDRLLARLRQTFFLPLRSRTGQVWQAMPGLPPATSYFRAFKVIHPVASLTTRLWVCDGPTRIAGRAFTHAYGRAGRAERQQLGRKL